jgi:ethanolamine ammonia-lyase small subunit
MKGVIGERYLNWPEVGRRKDTEIDCNDWENLAANQGVQLQTSDGISISLTIAFTLNKCFRVKAAKRQKPSRKPIHSIPRVSVREKKLFSRQSL